MARAVQGKFYEPVKEIVSIGLNKDVWRSTGARGGLPEAYQRHAARGDACRALGWSQGAANCAGRGNASRRYGTEVPRGLKTAFRFFRNLDIQPFNLLVQSGKRDMQTGGSLSLAAVVLLQALHNYAALEVCHDFKQRGVDG
jgi:hypothetical protein